jgi:hypothetical protein
MDCLRQTSHSAPTTTPVYMWDTNDLRTRMLEHYNNPPIIGVTHFFAEAIATEEQRLQREKERKN